jgi:transposase
MVARRYDVNANQVFSWRRRYREASEPSAASLPTPGLLPVTITPAPEDEPAAPPTLAASDTIEIEVSGIYRVRVGSGFDPRSLKRVLDVLRRR